MTPYIVAIVLFLTPAAINFIWGLFCWRERRLFVWAMTNFGVVILLWFAGAGQILPQSSLPYMLMESLLLVFIPLAFFQMCVVLLKRYQAEQREIASRNAVHLLGAD